MTGYYDHDYLTLVQAGPSGETLWKIRAARVVLATGAIERPMVFAGNDRPGVMLAGAVLGYLRRYGVLCGRRVVLCTNNDSVYAVARALVDAGATVQAVLDTRAQARRDRARRARCRPPGCHGRTHRRQRRGVARSMRCAGRPPGGR